MQKGPGGIETTGLRENLPTFIEPVRAITDTPLAFGFGISTPEHAAAVA